MIHPNEWFLDKEGQYKQIYHKVREPLISMKTKFQEVKIIDTYNLGRVVVLDDKIQSTEVDEFIYHEALVHPSMITHPNPKDILILGGGEGATLREVLKHPTVKKVTMVDIDEEFVNLCKKYLEKWHDGSFNDERVELIFEDAMEYIKKTDSKFDVIISDLSDPVEKGPAVMLYTKEFYSLAKDALMPDGIFVTHATEIYHIFNEGIFTGIFRMFSEIFPVSDFYYEYVHGFSCLWAFAIGSLKYTPSKMPTTLIADRLKRRKLDSLSYYDEETHRRLFCLPKCLRKLLGTI